MEGNSPRTCYFNSHTDCQFRDDTKVIWSCRKRDLLKKLLLLDEEGHSMVTYYVKTINVKDVVYTSAAS